ncbi:MAG: TetR/AcrR family transcriptional regulator, partial [Gammaproteobacteria bacterium]
MAETKTTVRERNMQKRRARILAEARGLLSSGGFEALNLRDLASKANVTVPTIYNLVGKKEDVLLTLAADVVGEIEARIPSVDGKEPLKIAASMVVESSRLFAEDEDYYRSAFLAVEGMDQNGQLHYEVERIYAWAAELMRLGIDACRKAKLIRGRVPAAQMSALMVKNFRMNCRQWAFGHCTIEAFRKQALSDVYLILAADAIETFHARLMRELKQYHQEN